MTLSRSNCDLFVNNMSYTIVTFYEQHNMPWYLNRGPLDLQSQHSTTVPPGMLAPSSDYFSYLMTALP